MLVYMFSFARLTRIDSSLIASSIIFIPLWHYGFAFFQAVFYALPVLFASMGGFILNDVEDIEKDIINHPSRPIPKGEISELKAMTAYFILLILTLFLIKITIQETDVYFYLAFILLFVNYNYVTTFFPLLKNMYVACVASMPFFIVVKLTSELEGSYMAPIATIFFVTGRELLMDIVDQAGDGNTLAKKIGLKASAKIAFTLQFFGILSLLAITDSIVKAISIAVIFFAFILFKMKWENERKRKGIIHLMKLQMVLGVIFLIQI